MKKITVLGAGQAGGALILNLKEKGVEVTVGLREPSKFEGAVSIKEAIQANDVVVLALPYDAGYEVVKTFKDALNGKTIVDMMNPLLADLSGYKTFDQKSGAEHLQDISTTFNVVEAFNHCIAPSIAHPDGSVQFIVGQDKDAVDNIRDLANKLGFEAHSIYDLSKAREIEGLAFFWIYFTILVKENPFIQLKIKEDGK
ncbi:hypothetical protein AOC36_07430 [Erysipelothrix larvae]|uniref:Pyrroline-5-carboxylate reductase catalytic N-terminal domain-containing protein n=1 Tax=Erysipelothrix larvae TaxID=1514105 RepID=A0A0X8H0G5_9FIRM|nr:NAD(P)-binding domain-containing protein [Erysipelothrix larvae]AMC93820.1 hypothetical protein AOC36_07430 [Erysipelothrix larvae]